MELKDFISQTLTAIVEGVVKAQEATKTLGAFVNPGGLTRTSTKISDDAIWDNTTNNIARMVSFDVAVTIEEGTKSNAKVGVVTGIFNLGAAGASEAKQQAISRIQFVVPVLLPTIDKANARIIKTKSSSRQIRLSDDVNQLDKNNSSS